AFGTVAAVLGLCLVALAVSWLAAPDDPTGYGPAAERAIVDACTRARGGEGEESCRCAYRLLADNIPWERAVELDEQLSRGEPLPEDIATLVARCGTGPTTTGASSPAGTSTRVGDVTSPT